MRFIFRVIFLLLRRSFNQEKGMAMWKIVQDLMYQRYGNNMALRLFPAFHRAQLAFDDIVYLILRVSGKLPKKGPNEVSKPGFMGFDGSKAVDALYAGVRVMAKPMRKVPWLNCNTARFHVVLLELKRDSTVTLTEGYEDAGRMGMCFRE